MSIDKNTSEPAFDLNQCQQQLMNYLLDGEKTIAKHIVDHGNITIDTRLNIYGNAYFSRLKETIETDHQLSGAYLGDDLFDAMVAGYIKECASKNRSLRQFGDELPEYLTRHEPFNQHPQISELVRFERLLLTAFDAADSSRAQQSDLAAVDVNDWPELKIQFHPSVQLFETDWNIVAMWQALKQEQTPPDPTERKNTWLVWRNSDLLTEFYHASAVELWMYYAFSEGQTFADVCDSLLELLPEDEVSAAAVNALVQWLNKGLIQTLSA